MHKTRCEIVCPSMEYEELHLCSKLRKICICRYICRLCNVYAFDCLYGFCIAQPMDGFMQKCKRILRLLNILPFYSILFMPYLYLDPIFRFQCTYRVSFTHCELYCLHRRRCSVRFVSLQ